MAEQLDRVRISAAELRAQGAATSDFPLDKEEHHASKKHWRRADSHRCLPAPKSAPASDAARSRPRNGKVGDGGAAPAEALPENRGESREPAGEPKKARKPDREFYRPGSRRGKDGAPEPDETSKVDRREAGRHKESREKAKSEESDGSGALETLAGKVERLSVEAKGGEEAARRRRRAGKTPENPRGRGGDRARQKRPRESRRRSRDGEEGDAAARRNDRRKGQRGERTESDGGAPASKRYSESDGRRRAYSGGRSSGDSGEGDAAEAGRTDDDGARGSKGRGTPEKNHGPGERRQRGPLPRGRGGGILVLPSRGEATEPHPAERGRRLLSGGASRGRGGGVRRLWDPNDPERKPALASGGRPALPSTVRAVYPQGYGQLHFLDTDDEAPAAAALANYYKFQRSDDPYAAGQRYPFPLAAGDGAHAHRGYAQTAEEAERRARGELGRTLRAADAQEVQLGNLLSRDGLGAEGLERMAQLRAELLAVYERVVLSDIELADAQGVDQALWKNVFYQVIERFRQLLKDPAADAHPLIRDVLLTLLDEGACFFDALLQKLQTVYQFQLEDYMDGVAIRSRPLRKTVKYALISAQRCLICQGDIARYREQAGDSANYGKARSWYLKAQQIAPKNGRPYNQLALLAVYTKRKLDAVYYYMRSLAASNPILTAKESLMSLFEEAKRKTEQLERRRRQERRDGGSGGPAVRGRAGSDDGARREVWLRPGRSDPEQDAELGSLGVAELNKRFILSFLHAHGKLFTKVGMESFPRAARRALLELGALLRRGPAPLGATQLLQIVTVNMFAVHNALARGDEGGGETRSVLLEQSTALGLAVFALLVQRCTEMLADATADAEREDGKEPAAPLKVSAFPADLRELLPAVKAWSDWMLGHPEQWNPPPRSLDSRPDTWQCLAHLCNVLAHVDHGEVPLYKVDTEEAEGDEELTPLQLKEDRLLAGFVPLLAAPQEPSYVDRRADTAIAADCKRVTVLKYFLEALCGQEEPLLAFKGGKYISVAPSPPSAASPDAGTGRDSPSDKEVTAAAAAKSALYAEVFNGPGQGDDVAAESSASEVSEEEEEEEAAEDGRSDIRRLKARRHALANELAQQQKRRQKIQAALRTGGRLRLEVRPLFLVPDTNGFIDHLAALEKLLRCGSYIVVVPLIVITELDGLAKGQDASGAYVRGVQEKARRAVLFLEESFEAREPRLRALTSRGNQLESIAFRSEDTSGQQGNNDDVILSCCLHYCQDKAKDFMPDQKNGTVRLQREVVLLTDDRNLRVKALTRNVPVRDIPAFLSWAKVG
ncbi:telomerase-binding protein EST1A isoform X1 [Corythoichthys intestinalis]|uniref:telomerase-binding protein EST1A isoform X1 n=1 Tax=Corythoichthys intestinalis TaxID=161448 RepID=UPI0025A5B8C8|nr:telomerase-binding protein EST1A isoform X1 [Corythoichthys intestinalis]